LNSGEASGCLLIEWKNDSGSHNRAGQTTTTSLVESGDKGIALREQGHFFF
jgi:hypothetical protein